jgi:hypothetical protein
MNLLPRSCVYLALAAGLLAASCSSSSGGGDAPGGAAGSTSVHSSAAFRKTLANPAPAELAEGERIYYEETYGTETMKSWPPADFMVSLWQKDPDKWGQQFASYGWITDPGDDLPVGLKRGSKDPTLIHETCASCHVTRLDDGRLWSGMPAVHLDWARFRLDVDDAWVKAGFPAIIGEAERAKLRGIQQRGASNADSTDDPHVVPADFPLYVNLGKRKNLGYTGAGHDARSQVFLSVFSFGAGDSLPFPDDAHSGALVDYLSWTTPPVGPSQDAAAVGRGQAVFDKASCGSCHHTDDLSKDTTAEWSAGPELLPGEDPMHPTGTIATDRNFYGLSAGFDDGTGGTGGSTGGGPGPGLDKLISFIIENRLKVGQTNGYAVTDLHGIAYTAPYLHNGSVPTLEALFLPPASRPVTFEREGSTVDTTRDGMSNAGHAFGTTLPDADKADLIVYLRSL